MVSRRHPGGARPGRARPTAARLRRAGATLPELLVTVLLFSVMMTLIATIHVEGMKVTRSQDKYSDSYRRVLGLLERLETMLQFSRVFRVAEDQIVFAPLPVATPLLNGRPNWPAQVSTLRVDRTGSKPRLWLAEGDSARLLLQLENWDYLTFSANNDLSVVYVTAKSEPDIDSTRQEGNRLRRVVSSEERMGGSRDAGIQITRHILLENVESF